MLFQKKEVLQIILEKYFYYLREENTLMTTQVKN